VTPDGVVKKKRGRPPGLCKQPHWKKPGPKGRKPKAKANISEEEAFCLEMCDETTLKAEGETAVIFTVQVARSEALFGPNAIKHMESDSIEKLRLESERCWKPMAGELQPGEPIAPSCVLHSIKRGGAFKARLVALGNRQKVSDEAEIYSPAISHAGNRFVLVEGAHSGHHNAQFDLTQAFTNALLKGDKRIIARLPKHWSTLQTLKEVS
jgi:hypothetical protein